MSRVVVRPAAAADIESAFVWCQQQHDGLGFEFLDALRATLDRIMLQPDAFPLVHREARRALIPRRWRARLGGGPAAT